MAIANGSTEHYMRLASRRVQAFRKIAQRLGETHEVTQLMGTLSYGRAGLFEPGPDVTLRRAIEYFAYLEGVFHVLNRWALDHDRKAQRIMLELWPHGRSVE